MCNINTMIHEAERLKYEYSIDATTVVGKLLGLTFDEVERMDLLQLDCAPLRVI